ncbi:MAG: hypothetical protein WBA41_24970 [Rivularia sp. (in: cyanobacteria)]
MINLKLVNVLAVCLIALTVISPSLTVFGLVWKKHIEFVEMQQNIPSYNQSMESECFVGTQLNSLTNSDVSNLYPNPDRTKLNLSGDSQIRLWRWLYLFVPFCIVTGIYLYDRYLVYRANLFQQQVEMLEKLWQHLEK